MRVSNVTVRKRLVFVLLAGFLIFAVIEVRLGYVQFVLGGQLTSLAKDLWSRNIPFEPKRGEIVDRNGEKLATNVSAPSVFIIPRQVENPAETAQKLASVLNMPTEKAYQYVTKKEMIVRVHPEGRKISDEKAQEIRSLNLKGVYIAEDSKRYYPFNSLLAHVLGFTGIDNQGLSGLELYYDRQLKGQKGYVKFYSDAKGKRMPNEVEEYMPPVDGLNLKLTIDAKIQSIIERELDIAESKYNPDGIIAIAMNPNNGEILGMASRPTFDPTKYQHVDPKVYNRNLPIWSTYEPGSTFKIITLAAALEEKKVDLYREHFYDPGYVKVAGATLRCWKKADMGIRRFLKLFKIHATRDLLNLDKGWEHRLCLNILKNLALVKKRGLI